MIVEAFLSDVNEANMYVVACDRVREAMLIDAAALDPAVEGFLQREKLRLAAIFITHDHYDHSGALKEWVNKYGAAVYAGSVDPGGVRARFVEHNYAISVGGCTGHVLATPGHTPDARCIHFNGAVFTGDALFAGAVGGTGSDANARRQIEHLRTHILALPDTTVIYPGHGPASTVAIERRFNPFLTDPAQDAKAKVPPLGE